MGPLHLLIWYYNSFASLINNFLGITTRPPGKLLLAAGPGLEPGLDDPESSVLPLNDPAAELALEDSYVGEMAIVVFKIHSVADNEHIRDLESAVISIHFYCSLYILV